MTPRRILVALDHSRSARTALETAAAMAAQGDAELVGLYVEDQTVLQAAALPVTHLIERHGHEREMAAADMERAFRIAAREARLVLRDIGERLRIKASFEVRRGPLQSAMVAAAGRFDLVSVGATGRPGSQAGSVARALMMAGPCAVLIARRQLRRGEPVTLLAEPGPQPLALARELSLLRPRRLRILAPAGVTDLDRVFDAETLALIRGLESCEIETLGPGALADQVSQALGRRPAGLLMTARGGPLAGPVEITALLSHGLADAILLTAAAQTDGASGKAKDATTGA